LRVDRFDYDLPEDAVAQEPVDRRDASRLFVLGSRGASAVHTRFRDLPEFLEPRDLLVLNDTRVLPARLLGARSSGGAVELLLLEESPGRVGEWSCMLRSGRSPKPGEVLSLDGGLTAEVVSRREDVWLVRLAHPTDEPAAVVERVGRMPLPPYIRRAIDDPRASSDRERYQTVYARRPGAVAAPTAGLHFTPELIAELDRRGIRRTFVTLHVGAGTFRPVRVDTVENHHMHSERLEIRDETAAAVTAARERGGRIVAVGTTVVRALESRSDGAGGVRAGSGRSELFIYPGYRFGVVDAMITNFHLPRSTLLMLVCAFAGRERILEAYREALRLGYRFFSYGDAMMLEP
jgi:S-adenosylmethionine:tRNA ribosyltransferase-isomerase